MFEDYWGIRSKHLKADHGSYDMHVHTPVWDAQSVGRPQEARLAYARHIRLLGHARAVRPLPGGGYAIMYEGADLFTRPCILRNMENVMLDMIERPEMAHYLFDQFTTFYCEDITRALEATDGGLRHLLRVERLRHAAGFADVGSHVPRVYRSLFEAADRCGATRRG